MGRPKGSKNKSKSTTNSTTNSTPELTTTTAATTTNETTITTPTTPDTLIPQPKSTSPSPTTTSHSTLTCARCHTIIPTQSASYAVNVAALTGLPNWYRSIKNDRIILCKQCAMGINEIINKYLETDGNGNEGVETKYPTWCGSKK